MQAQEVLRQLRIPELDDLRQYVRGLPTNALMGMGAFAALTTYWFASRPKALKAPCDLGLQSVEIPVGDLFLSVSRGRMKCFKFIHEIGKKRLHIHLVTVAVCWRNN